MFYIYLIETARLCYLLMFSIFFPGLHYKVVHQTNRTHFLIEREVCYKLIMEQRKTPTSPPQPTTIAFLMYIFCADWWTNHSLTHPHQCESAGGALQLKCFIKFWIFLSLSGFRQLPLPGVAPSILLPQPMAGQAAGQGLSNEECPQHLFSLIFHLRSRLSQARLHLFPSNPLLSAFPR